VTATLFDGPPPWYVPDSPLPTARRIAVIAPHPDDFDVIGFTMRLFHRASARIDVAVLTSGASGVEDGFVIEGGPGPKGRIREREQEVSCAFFGLPAGQLQFLRLAEDPHGHMDECVANRERVAAFLSECRPEFVFLPHGNDPNLAHQRTFAIVADALSRQGSAATMWLNRDPKTTAMREDVYVVFDDEAAEWKRTLLRHHASQQARNLRTRGHGFDERILRGNSQAALSAGRPGAYAETFELRSARALTG
jgi:LmbE family N-acetylglucosaminyl deacetylase